jgi:uncharacterized protein (TIRG00374 family)
VTGHPARRWGRSTSRPGGSAKIRFALRAAIGLSVVVLLLSRADVDDIRDALERSDPTLLLLGTVAYFGSLLLSPLRWRGFLRALGIEVGLARLVRLYLSGTFFNAFLPTGVGGDAYKAIVLSRGKSSIEDPLASAFLDRSAGMAGLALLTIVGTGIQIATGATRPPTWVASAIAIAVSAVGGAALLIARRERSGPESHPEGLLGRLRLFIRAVRAGLRHPAGIQTGALWGLVTALLLVLAHAFLLRGVEISLPPSVIPGIVLVAALTAVVPVSINGLGLREAAYVWMLGAYGVDHDTALAFALLVLAVMLITSALGAIVYLISDESLPRRLEDVEDGRDDQQVDADQEGSDAHEYRRG